MPALVKYLIKKENLEIAKKANDMLCPGHVGNGLCMAKFQSIWMSLLGDRNHTAKRAMCIPASRMAAMNMAFSARLTMMDYVAGHLPRDNFPHCKKMTWGRGAREPDISQIGDANANLRRCAIASSDPESVRKKGPDRLAAASPRYPL